ncbi:hypothetical protein Tco_0946044 [Tanacetum coccineum]
MIMIIHCSPRHILQSDALGLPTWPPGVSCELLEGLIFDIVTCENNQEDEQQEQAEEEVTSQNTSNRKKNYAKKNKATSKRDAAADTQNDEQTSRQKTSKKVVEKLVSSKKAKQVSVESELVPVDNDAPVFADEEEAEIVGRNKKKINDAPNKVIQKVVGGNKRKKDVNKGNKVDGKLVSFKKFKQVVDGSELVLVDNQKEGCKYDPVKINTRMSLVHLKNVLSTCTLLQIMDLNEMGLGHFHNNFNFESTPGELGM